MELPTNDIKEHADDCDGGCNNSDPHQELIKQFCGMIADTDDTTPLITPQESIQRTYIEKLYKQLLSIRKRENIVLKLKSYRHFDRYLSKLRKEPFFQD